MLHKYWRLEVASTGSTYFQVTEVAFLNAAGVVVSVGGVASANSEYSAGYIAANAFDKSAGTDYCNVSGRFPVRLQYACPSAVEIASVRITWGNQPHWLPSSPDAMILVSSADGTRWTDFYDLVITSGGFVAGTVAVASVTYRGVLQSVETGNTKPVWSAPVVDGTPSVRMGQAMPVRDVEFGGSGIITGTVKEKNTPANTPLRRRTVLIDERSGLKIRETWSDAVAGDYEFRGIREGVPYTVLSYDHLHNYRAVAADNLLAEDLP